ncbi:MAG: thermonuclease family protein [Acidimicrobiia bacterium]|nr:thermonuclease family protein [Acidimicrobiia bacterium]MYC57063.1 thermonuclease family protein [Acidimicrobiia bacterium]MYG93670.1 thermonuclease family protein [Acidimicrobiia bacterium]MYI30140.1 thermonuclease family protein [Acidimicrobiia bacterium]
MAAANLRNPSLGINRRNLQLQGFAWLPLVFFIFTVLATTCVLLSGCGSDAQSLLNQLSREAEPASSSTIAGVTATIVRVLDGDTIDVKIAGYTERVRLIGIDTPEATGGILPTECYGDEASDFTKSLLPVGTTVLLTRDSEIRDRYGRLLAYVHRAQDNMFVNLEIVVNGYADVLVIAPNTIYANHFFAAAQQAREQGLGLWSKCGSADVTI